MLLLSVVFLFFLIAIYRNSQAEAMLVKVYSVINEEWTLEEKAWRLLLLQYHQESASFSKCGLPLKMPQGTFIKEKQGLSALERHWHEPQTTLEYFSVKQNWVLLLLMSELILVQLFLVFFSFECCFSFYNCNSRLNCGKAGQTKKKT